MPTYEYACTACKRHFEVWQSFQDEALETCEECQGRLRRVFHPVGVLFKGSGFYSTDARSAAKRKGSDSRPSGEKDSGQGSGRKPDGSASEGGSASESKSTTKDGDGSSAKSPAPKKSSTPGSGTPGKEKSA